MYFLLLLLLMPLSVRGMFIGDDLGLPSLERLTYGMEWRSSSLSPTWQEVQQQVYPQPQYLTPEPEEFSHEVGLAPAFVSKLPKGKGDSICESSSADLEAGASLPFAFPIVPKPAIRKKSMQRPLASPPISPTRKIDSKKNRKRAAGNGVESEVSVDLVVSDSPFKVLSPRSPKRKKTTEEAVKGLGPEAASSSSGAAFFGRTDSSFTEADRQWIKRMNTPSQTSDAFMNDVFKDEAYRASIQHAFKLMQKGGITESAVLGCAFIVLAVARDYYTLGSKCFRLDVAKKNFVFNKMVDSVHKSDFKTLAGVIYEPLLPQDEKRTSMHGMIDSVWSWLFKEKYLVKKGGKKEYYAEDGSLSEKVINKIYALKQKPEDEFCAELSSLL